MGRFEDRFRIVTSDDDNNKVDISGRGATQTSRFDEFLKKASPKAADARSSFYSQLSKDTTEPYQTNYTDIKRAETQKATKGFSDRLQDAMDSYNRYYEEGKGVGSLKPLINMADRKKADDELKSLKSEIDAYYKSNMHTADKDYYQYMLDKIDEINGRYISFDSKVVNDYDRIANNKEYAEQKKQVEDYQKLIGMDTEAAQNEIDTLTETLDKVEKADSSRPSVNEDYLNERANSTWDARARITAQRQIDNSNARNSAADDAINMILDGTGYTSSGELRNAIYNKTLELNTAKRLQEWQSLTDNAMNHIGFDFYSQKGMETVDSVKEQAKSGLAKLAVESKDEDIVSLMLNEMTEDEWKVYAFYIGKGDPSTANEYLDTIRETLNYRQADKKFKEDFEGNTLKEIAYGLATGIKSAGEGIGNFVKSFGDDTYIPASVNQQVSSMIREDLYGEGGAGGWLARTAYDVNNTVGMMIPSITVSRVAGVLGASSALNSVVSSAVMAVPAAGNDYAEYLNKGMNPDQARSMSYAMGIWEGASEVALGAIENIGNKWLTDAIRNGAKKGYATAVGKFLLKATDSRVGQLAIDAMQEGLEEVIQDIGSSAIESFYTGKFDVSSVEDLAYSFILGALSAGVLNSVQSAPEVLGEVKTAKAIRANTDRLETVKNLAEGYDVSTLAGRLAGKINPQMGAYQLANVLHSMNANLSETNQNEIKQALINEGMAEKDASTISEYLGVAVEGGTLPRSKQKAIEENDVIAKVFHDFLDKNSTVNQRLYNLAEVQSKSGTVSKDYGVDYQAMERASSPTALTLSANLNTNLEKYNSSVSDSNIRRLAPNTLLEQVPSEETASLYRKAASGNTAVNVRNLQEKANKVKASNIKAVAEAVDTIRSDADADDFDGKTTIASTGEEVKIKKITSTDGNGLTLELDNGQTVSSSDISYASKADAIIYETLAGVDISAGSANAIVNAYKASNRASPAAFILGMIEAYNYGTISSDSVDPNGFAAELSKTARDLAISLGKNDANTSMEKAQSGTVTAGKKAGRITYLGKAGSSGLSQRQKASMNIIDKVIKHYTKGNVYVYESEVADGRRVVPKGIRIPGVKQGDTAPNGAFDTKTGDIYLDLNAGNNGEGVMLYTFAHELTHYLRKYSPKDFKKLADFLVSEFGRENVAVSRLISHQLELGDNIKFDDAYEEMVADAMQGMFTNADLMSRLAKLKTADASLWEKIKDFFTRLYNLVKEAYKGLTPQSAEAQYLLHMKESMDKLADIFAEGLVNAGNSDVVAQIEQAGIGVDSNTDSGTLLSVRNVLEEKSRNKTAKLLAKRFDVTEAEAKEWIDAETSLASLILNPKYSQYIDYEADPDELAIKQNSDYPQGTVDFSNICAKRREFTAVMNSILRLFPGHIFAATDLAKIRTIMSEEGMKVPCGICYVEDRRQLDTIIAQDFIDGLALYRSGSSKRPDGKAFNTNQLKGLALTDGSTYVPSIYELVSLEGRNKLKKEHPEIEAAWVKYNNARGMQAVRLLTNDAEYKRQILKYSANTVKGKNDKGGLRIYSFSDAEMFHLIDIVQIITDSAAVGLSLQGYTKVNEYAKAVKDTGLKLNRSLIPLGDLGYHMEGDRAVLDWDTVEGIDINSKDFFDNRNNPNIGNITIGINDKQIRTAMVSDFVDQIIPFHTGQSGDVLEEKGISAWNNYKDEQTDKDIATGKTSDHQINIYTEVLQVLEDEGREINKRSFVEKFLEVCKENGLKPRFDRFLDKDENGDYIYTEGYHKMLVDFKTFAQTEEGEYLPQLPVKPIFNNKYMTSLLKNYVREQAAKDSQLAESMPKVIKRITDEIVRPEKSAGKLSNRMEDEVELRQEHTSAGTSINSDKIPSLYTNKNAVFVKGGTNIDIGAGKFDTATDYLSNLGVTSLPFDPFNRTKSTNLKVLDFLRSGKKADTATCSNVLNVIDSAKGRANVILEMAKSIKPDGTAYFTVYENKKNLEEGKAGESKNKPDQWQEFRATKTYVDEIKQYFNDVSNPKSGLIIARSPKANLPQAIWQISDKRGTVGETTDEYVKYSSRSEVELGTLFSGADTFAYALDGLIHTQYAAENRPEIVSVYKMNHGGIVFEDVLDIDVDQMPDVQHLHVSPPCVNFSNMRNNQQERPIDKELATKVAEIIKAKRPRALTIENVERYATSESMNIIRAALKSAGYKSVDIATYKDSDFGGYTNRERVVLRAMRDEELPPVKGKTPKTKGWGEAVSMDFINSLSDAKNINPRMINSLKELSGIDVKKINRPLLVFGESYKNGQFGHAFSNQVCPTIIAESGASRIFLPNGTVKEATPEVLAKIMGIDGFKLPSQVTTARRVIGNGIPAAITQNVMGPVIEMIEADNKARISRGEDIKFSSREFAKGAEDYYGTTNNWELGGYLTVNGKMLDFSAGQRQRVIDHREISDYYEENGIELSTEMSDKNSGFLNEAMIRFMNDGNIRFQAYNGFEIATMPTREQISTMRDIIDDYFGGYCSIDYADANGRYLGTSNYEEDTSSTRIINDIRKHFEDGSIPEGNAKFSRRDEEYMELAKNPKTNENKLRELIVQEARLKGYDSEMLYHGTDKFGFTKILSSAGDDGFSFFATNTEETANSYSYNSGLRSIKGEEIDWNGRFVDAKKQYNDAITSLGMRMDEITGMHFTDYDSLHNDFEAMADKYDTDGNKDALYDSLVDYITFDLLGDVYESSGDTREYWEWEEEYESEFFDYASTIYNTIIARAEAIYGYETETSNYGIYSLYANTDNMLIVEGNNDRWNKIRLGKLTTDFNDWWVKQGHEASDNGYYPTANTRDIAAYAFDKGYDGVRINSIYDDGGKGYKIKNPADVYIFFKPSSQVKSADLVTYDDDGNIIPLSERFNSGNNDVRFSQRDTLSADEHRQRAEDLFETTDDIYNASFLLSDGKMLNNKNTGNRIGRKFGLSDRDYKEMIDEDRDEMAHHINHDDIIEVFSKEYRDEHDTTDAIVDFINEGNIRLVINHNWGSAVEISANSEPTPILYRNLSSILERLTADHKDFMVGIVDDEGRDLASYNYEAGFSADKVISDIRYYFVNGEARDNSLSRFYYSKRNTKSTDNRTLLSNALATVAKNDTEKQYISDYQDKIGKINEEQKKLTELRSKIKELSFAPGKRDKEQLKKLQDEATKTANRINIFDKQLLRLEAAKPLKDVLARERKKAKAKAEAEATAMVEKEKAKALENQKALIDKYRTRMKAGTEGRNKTILKNKIKKVVKEMDAILNRGSKERNVKIGMRDAVSQALDTAKVLFSNMEASDIILNGVTSATPEENETITKYLNLYEEMNKIAAELEAKNDEGDNNIAELVSDLEKKNNRLKAYEKKLESLVVRERERIMHEAVGSAIQKLADAYKDIINAKNSSVKESYQPEVYDRLITLKNDLGGTTINDMTLDQLDEVYQAYKMIAHTITSANKLFRAGKVEELARVSQKWESELATNKAVDERSSLRRAGEEFMFNEMKPLYAFKLMNSPTGLDLYHDFELAEDKWARDVEEARQTATALRDKYGYGRWNFDKPITIDISSGKFDLTLGKLMSIYAYSRREQALKHMSEGGFVLNSKEAFRKVKNGRKSILTYTNTARNAFRVNKDDLNKIANEYLTIDQKKYVTEMEDYLTAMGEKGNEAARILYGIDIFREKVYFPLTSSDDYVFSANQPAGQVSLKNTGMTKETVPNANNPIVLEDFDDVWGRHIGKMATYHSFVVPIDNFNKAFNYANFRDSDTSTSVKSTIKSTFGDAGKNYIDKLIQDLNGGTMGDNLRSPLTGLIGRFKKTAVSASASVVIQQYTAIFRAMSMIDPKYFVRDRSLGHKAKWEQLKKYAPVAIIKEIGGFDTGGGRNAQNYLDDTKTFMEKADDILMRPAGFADELGWNSIWDACKNETKKKTGLNGEPMLRKAGERFSEVIRATQVYDSTLSRSGYMRSSNDIVKMATAFMGEPTTSFNMMFDSIYEAKKGSMSKGKAVRNFAYVMTASIAACILKSLVGAARKDDEDKSYLNLYSEALADNIADELNFLNLLPFAKDVVSIFQGWDVERTDMALVQDLYDAWEGLFKDSKSAYRKIEDFGGAVANMFGVPAKNIMRDGRSLYNVIRSLTDDNKPKNLVRDFGETFLNNVLKTVTLGRAEYDTSLKAFYGRGDMDRVEEIISDTVASKVKAGKTEKSAYSTLRSQLNSEVKSQYLSGELTAVEACDRLANINSMTKGDKTPEDIYWTVDGWEYEAEFGTSEGYSKYTAFVEAVQTGKNLKAEIKRYTDNGVKAETLASQITSHFKPIYIAAGSNAERANLKGYLLNAYVLLGYDREKKSKDIDKWLK